MSETNSALRTLCIVQQPDRVLLGLKKRGFGAHKWNGFGGKVEGGETLLAAALRELHEEATITADAAAQRAVLTFSFDNGLPALAVHVFVVEVFSGQPQETEEMLPRWFPIDQIPYQDMWADEPHWLPLVLTGKYLRGHFVFSDEAHLREWEVKEVADENALRHIHTRGVTITHELT